MGKRVSWEILVLVQFAVIFSYFCPDLEAYHLFGKYTGSESIMSSDQVIFEESPRFR